MFAVLKRFVSEGAVKLFVGSTALLAAFNFTSYN